MRCGSPCGEKVRRRGILSGENQLLVQQVVDREAEHGISHTMIRSQMPAIYPN